MKRYKVRIQSKRHGEVTVTVTVEDATSRALNQVDEKTREEYLKEEYLSSLTDRKETRRAQSLDASMDGGHPFPDGSPGPEELLLMKERRESLTKALSSLSEEQRRLIKAIFAEGKTRTAVAAEEGVSVAAICSRLEKIYAKIRKNMSGGL